MTAIEPRTLAWAPSAPVQNKGRARSSASPEAVFAVLADQAAWPTWFPTIKKVTVDPGAIGVGSHRTVKLPGLTVNEEFLAYDPGRLFAFTGIGVKPRAFSALVEQCVLEPTADGGTDVTWVQSLTPGNAVFGFIMKLARPMIVRSLDKAMTNLARRAESS
jgi:uncharacterized protein YndB with AHSA1/START domain